MEEQPTKSRRGRPPKNPEDYAPNPNARNVRAYRARKKEQDDEKYREEQRKYKTHYNKNWEEIKAQQPIYNDPPYEYRKPETQQTNDDNDSNTNSDKDENVSVKSSEQLDKMIDDTLDEIEQELDKGITQEKGKHYVKNSKRRQRQKQEKKKNKIPQDEVELDN